MTERSHRYKDNTDIEFYVCWGALYCRPISFPSLAVDGGHREVVQLLVSRGAEVTGVHTACRWTCLHHAVYKVTLKVQ